MTNINVAAALSKAARRLTHGRQNLDGAWQDLAEAWQEVADVVAELNTDLERERARNDELAARLEEVMKTLAAHDARLNALSQQRTAERLTSGRYMAHHEIAERYRNLRDQTLVGLVYDIPNLTPQDEATVLSWLNMALFLPGFTQYGPEGAYRELCVQGKVRVPQTEFNKVWLEASKIRQEASESGHPHKWHFGCHPGKAVDGSSQEVYEGCQPDGSVMFVVAPAYVVDDNTVYVKQQVFTAPILASPSASSAQQGSYWDKESDSHAGEGEAEPRKGGGMPPGYQPGPSDRQATDGGGEYGAEQEGADGDQAVDAAGPQ